LGVERFTSEIRAVTNLFSNIFATIVVSRWMGEIEEEEHLHRVLDAGLERSGLERTRRPRIA
jgi:Na+/H+-dicarboxylate symporter